MCKVETMIMSGLEETHKARYSNKKTGNGKIKSKIQKKCVCNTRKASHI